jgi:GxxExxY protein
MKRREENHEITKVRKHEEVEERRRGEKMGHEFEPLSRRIIEAALAVHRELGPGFIESIYHRAMEIALTHRAIEYTSEWEIHVVFEHEEAGCHRLDLVVGRQIVVELKAVKAFEDIHFAKLKSYLKATQLHVGLLINFNSPTLVVKRVVL